MPIKTLANIDNLPQRSATHVKTKWPSLKRKVRSAGHVAITRYGKVQVVAMDTALYREIAALADAARRDRR